jgi:hypothetical protein
MSFLTQQSNAPTFVDEISSLSDIPLSEPSTNNGSFLLNISWQTWIIIILVLALLGINVFVYLAKGTQLTATLFDQIFSPILKMLGYNVLETTKQTVESTATGTKAGVDIVSNTAIGAINTVQQPGQPQVQGQLATSSHSGGSTVQNQTQQIGQSQDSLEKALSNASQNYNVQPDDAKSSIQTTGKSGWCFIGEEQGIRSCSNVGVNDVCMSGDVFPSQEICVNPNLRA